MDTIEGKDICAEEIVESSRSSLQTASSFIEAIARLREKSQLQPPGPSEIRIEGLKSKMQWMKEFSDQYPELFKEHFGHVKSELFKKSIKEVDLRLISSLFSEKDEDLRRELQDVELEIDFGCYDFQKKFFSKYILMKVPNCQEESVKAKQLEVKVNLPKARFTYMTRTRLDSLLDSFRAAYKDFCKARSMLTDSAAERFNEIFNFENFVALNDQISDKMVIDETPSRFRLSWISEAEELRDDEEIDHNDRLLSEYLIGWTVKLFRPNAFYVTRTLLEAPELTNERIVGLLLNKFRDLFELLVKDEMQRYLRHTSVKASPFLTNLSSQS